MVKPMVKHLCSVCGKVAGRGTFLRVGCDDQGRWVHPKCGGYTSNKVQESGKKDQQDQLRCNNCKKGTFWTPEGKGPMNSGLLVSQ